MKGIDLRTARELLGHKPINRACASTSTMILIEKFIAFVDKNPKYTLASTAFQLTLAEEFACKK